MSETEACLTCRFSKVSKKGNRLCRRFPPQNFVGSAFFGISESGVFYAKVDDDDWCGEYQSTPAKIDALKRGEE